MITIRVSAQGAFTGGLHLAAKRYPISGFLRGNGQASISVPTAAGSFTLTFTIDPATQQLTGAIIAQTISTFTAAKVPYDGVSNRAPQAGRYTVMMSPIYTYSLSGNGYGPATMMVGAAGLVRVTGWTPQGNPFVSTPAYVGADGKFPFYAVQTSPRLASVQGIIHFAAQPGIADCSGNVGLAVMSPPNDPVANFAMTFLGSTYTVPAANELLLPWEGTQGIGNLETGWPATGTALTPVALNQRHQVTATPARIARIILNPKRGTFSGSLELRLADGLRRATARGIVFQAQGVAAGRWNVLGSGGAMRLIPVTPEIPDDRNPGVAF